ncbi:TonB-dependent receptor plug domain-containing protein [Phaeovulum sp.]|uniref:TonB-dependent receptor plug domain-containing protein n=1 Tax=Phaeovulum sp. TaxID=2934796 RepID=UPI0039E4CC22
MTRGVQTLTLMLLASTALATPAQAQDVVQLDDIVVTGAQEPRSVERTAAAVSVLTADDIARTGEVRMTEVLARLPGVGVLSRGPIGTQTGLTIRGVSQNYIKVLVDGIDVSDPSAPQLAYDFGRLSSLDFGRVEVLRGSQSAVHGGQAIGGVISLDAPRLTDEGNHHQLTLEAGSMNSAAGAWTFGHKTADTDIGFTLSHIRTDGFSAADENAGNTEADGYEATRLAVHAERRFGAGLVLGFSGFAQNDTSDIDNGFGVPSDNFDTTDHRERGARIFAQFDTGRIAHEIGVTYFTTYRYYTSAFGPADYDGSRRSLEWKASTDLGAGRLSFGLDRKIETYEGTYVAGRVTNGITGAFGEYAFTPMAGVDLIASLRHDDNSRFGGQTTGRVAATWALRDDLILRGAFGTGFRAPSGYELYDGFAGNPDLTPEESRNIDLGIEKKLTNGALRATLFRVDTDDLIDYVGGGYTQIPGKTRRQGVELEAEGRITGRIGYTAAYTYTDASNPILSAGSSWNAGFGRHQLALGLDADITEKLVGSVTLRHVADRQTLPDYTVLNASFGYTINDRTEAYLRVENLTDEQYQLWPGYGTSDRAVYVGLRAAF